MNRWDSASRLIAGLLVYGLVLGMDSRTSPTHDSRERPTLTETSSEQQARDWGLNTDEWARFQALMRGPLGVYSPHLDPLSALGIEARSDEERRHYAELQVQAEAHRVEKLLAYQHAYDDAWQQLYPAASRVMPLDVNTMPIASSTNERAAVFVKDECPACDQIVRQLQTAGMEFDIYVVGSHADDAQIRSWAQRVGVDPSKVRARHITLNHDAGRWLLLGQPGELPAVLHQVNGQWQRQ
ncbi:TIGR03759 family integrating conjugative element protein [Pseudomonas citronellolis]|uniref:TIGR03759 family integrating conjugative element protein n=1 Tax=Pseudomonas citronellolis TaxID=53408 RepID=UPI0021C0FA10|nr:TIGR03759 family integrating conjugative element protein [Pseudomonas citronellolis]UXJ50120.1 TIGR03759 family integrating conjugative element protein [Pseudomonas citronellolis]